MKKIFAVVCLVAVIFTLTACKKNDDILLAVDLENGDITAVRGKTMPETEKIEKRVASFISPVIFHDEQMNKQINVTESMITDNKYYCIIKNEDIESVYVTPPHRFEVVKTEPEKAMIFDENQSVELSFPVKNINVAEKNDGIAVELTFGTAENGKKSVLSPYFTLENKEYRGVPSLNFNDMNLIDDVVIRYEIKEKVEVEKLELVIDEIVVKTTDIQPQKVIIE
ncbi:MAG: hypothetical protein IJE55_00220 [Clostridia bacterium]|nr:hypothetical protein [Clostridia bacterium]